MAFTHKPNSGSAFKNDEMFKETDPMFKGTALIDGKEYWVSVWQNTAKATGAGYFSMRFNPILDAKPKVAEQKAKLDAPLESAWDDSTDIIPF